MRLLIAKIRMFLHRVFGHDILTHHDAGGKNTYMIHCLNCDKQLYLDRAGWEKENVGRTFEIEDM